MTQIFIGKQTLIKTFIYNNVALNHLINDLKTSGTNVTNKQYIEQCK